MASPTSHTAPPVAPMAPTPGVTPERHGGRQPSSSMTGAPQGPEVKGAEPILFTDLEPVHLVRLYPDAFAEGASPAGDLALAAGKHDQEEGLKLIADQQSPINWAGEAGPAPPVPPAPPAPEHPAASPRRHEPGPSKEA